MDDDRKTRHRLIAIYAVFYSFWRVTRAMYRIFMATSC